MQGAEVGVCPRLGKSEGKFFVGVQRFGLHRLIVADHGMRNVVAIGPGHLCPCGNGQSSGGKGEVVDFYFSRRCRYCNRRYRTVLRAEGCGPVTAHEHHQKQPCDAYDIKNAFHDECPCDPHGSYPSVESTMASACRRWT